MNELDKISEKILKHIIKHNNSLTPKNFNKLRLFQKYSVSEITECLKFLNEDNFLYLNNENLCSTFKAKQYFSLKRKKFIQNIIFLIVIPLFIGIAIAYLTPKFTTNNDVTMITKNIQMI